MHHCWVYAQTSPELQGYRLTKAIQIVKELNCAHLNAMAPLLHFGPRIFSRREKRFWYV